MKDFDEAEVRGAVAAYIACAERASSSGDWNEWAELFTPDAEYYEHEYGRFHGREAIRQWITSVMANNTVMDFPVDWYMVDGSRVVLYCQMRLRDPEGKGNLYQYPAVTILHYAGNGKFSYEEDIWNPGEGAIVRGEYAKATQRASTSA